MILVNVYVSDIGSICIHGKRITQTIYIPSNIQGKPYFLCRCSRYLKSWYWNNQTRFLECLKSAGKIIHGTIISGQWWRSHQSLACKGLCIFSFCGMYWKDESEPNIKYCLGTAVGLVQRFINNTELWTWLMENRWSSEWNISQDSQHCSSSKKFKSLWTKWANQNNSKDELSSCRCSMTSYGELKTMKRNVLLIPHLCFCLRHSSDLDQKQSGILLTTKDPKENGTKSLNCYWSNSKEADTQFSEPRVHCFEERSKSKGDGKLSIHFWRWPGKR